MVHGEKRSKKTNKQNKEKQKKRNESLAADTMGQPWWPPRLMVLSAARSRVWPWAFFSNPHFLLFHDSLSLYLPLSLSKTSIVPTSNPHHFLPSFISNHSIFIPNLLFSLNFSLLHNQFISFYFSFTPFKHLSPFLHNHLSPPYLNSLFHSNSSFSFLIPHSWDFCSNFSHLYIHGTQKEIKEH